MRGAGCGCGCGFGLAVTTAAQSRPPHATWHAKQKGPSLSSGHSKSRASVLATPRTYGWGCANDTDREASQPEHACRVAEAGYRTEPDLLALAGAGAGGAVLEGGRCSSAVIPHSRRPPPPSAAAPRQAPRARGAWPRPRAAPACACADRARARAAPPRVPLAASRRCCS